MTETLTGSALMKEASKFSETLQEYISGYENPMGEVLGSDLKRISLDLSFTKSHDELMRPLSICTWNWCRILLQLSRSGTRMVWESIASLIPILGQYRWNLSPPNRPLGFVMSKPSKPPMLGSLAKARYQKVNTHEWVRRGPCLFFILLSHLVPPKWLSFY